jgi:hypothetical protein
LFPVRKTPHGLRNISHRDWVRRADTAQGKTMALSVFDDKSRKPAKTDLSEALGTTLVLWDDLQARIAARFPSTSPVWAFSGKSTGWGMRLVCQDRIILYMTPRRGFFLVSFVLGERAVKAAQGSNLPAAVLAAIDSAKRYAEGTGVRFEIRDRPDVQSMETIAVLKMAR